MDLKWHFLLFYNILRFISNKLLGIIAMIFDILILLAMFITNLFGLKGI